MERLNQGWVNRDEYAKSSFTEEGIETKKRQERDRKEMKKREKKQRKEDKKDKERSRKVNRMKRNW